SGLFFALLFLFWLTFLESYFPYSYTIYNILNFAIVSLLLIFSIKWERHADTALALLFWFAYVGFKYYDLVWPLLHKSLTLLLIGALVLAVTITLDTLYGPGKDKSVFAHHTKPLPYAK